ncbi:MAG: hypothetical protein RR497_05805 [Oscillospiraceae bacterium]
MVKGVNKQIIEINYPQDEYIQKAILFVNPTKCTEKKSVLVSKATTYMDDIIKSSKGSYKVPLQKNKKKLKWKSMVIFTMSGLLGAIITAIISSIT